MSNAQAGRRTAEALAVIDHDPAWPIRFAELGDRLRSALGEVALRIDHIGSTAVPDLAAKPIIDVQISVVSLEPVDPFGLPLEKCGFAWRADNPERTKRYFRERPGAARTHIHVRRAGSFSEQFALLFRKAINKWSFVKSHVWAAVVDSGRCQRSGRDHAGWRRGPYARTLSL